MVSKKMKILSAVGALFLYLVFASRVFAVTISISGAPETLNEEEEFSLSVSVTGSSAIANKTYFLEGVFTKKDESASYFGWTQNEDGNWFNHGST